MTWILALILALRCELSACDSLVGPQVVSLGALPSDDASRAARLAVVTASARIQPRSLLVDAIQSLAQPSIRRDLGQRGPSKILINLSQVIAGFG